MAKEPKTLKAQTGQQIGLTDGEITDDDQIEAVRAWWESEVALNVAMANHGIKGLEKNLEDAKTRALEMITVPNDGAKHRITVQKGQWGTVIIINPPGEPKPVAFTRTPKTQFKLDNTRPKE